MNPLAKVHEMSITSVCSSQLGHEEDALTSRDPVGVADVCFGRQTGVRAQLGGAYVWSTIMSTRVERVAYTRHLPLGLVFIYCCVSLEQQSTAGLPLPPPSYSGDPICRTHLRRITCRTDVPLIG